MTYQFLHQPNWQCETDRNKIGNWSAIYVYMVYQINPLFSPEFPQNITTSRQRICRDFVFILIHTRHVIGLQMMCLVLQVTQLLNNTSLVKRKPLKKALNGIIDYPDLVSKNI